MSKQPTNDDAEVRRLLEQDRSEPPEYLDDEIRAAARDALADSPTAGRSASSRWPLPALAGVAATALLAVLVVQLAAPPALDVELDAVEQRVPATAPAPASSPPPPAKFPQELRRESSRAADQPAALTATGIRPEPPCPAGSAPLVAPGMLVCTNSEHLEVHSTQPDSCGDTLQLARQPGEVEVAPATDGIEVLIDGQMIWRVSCFNGTWQVRRIVRRDLNDAPEPRVSSDID